MSFTRQSSDVGGISGILRKGCGNSNISASESTISTAVLKKELRQVDLLVFGYACKIFRDDIKALEIDQGKHLIPWMGDSNLKIDRYDVRGAICDLSPYEPPPKGYGNRLDYLSSEEQRAEQLCEEERYLFLYNDEMDYIIRQEEELKSLQQETRGSNYSQVEFSYHQPQLPVHDCNNVKLNMNANSPCMSEHDFDQQPFHLPNNFTVPDGIQLPETMKQHVIIEKTARFIAMQGVQMEILLKAKQSNNVQFDFLAQNGCLHAYYKYILEAIKNGKYPEKQTPMPKAEVKEDIVKNINEANNCVAKDVDDCTIPTVTVPIVRYKPSADCAYTQLISRIKGVSLPELQEENSRQSNADDNCISPILQINDTTQAPIKTHTIGIQQQSDGNSQTLEVEVLKNTSALALARNYSSDSELEEEDVSKDNNTILIEPTLDIPIPSENLKNIIDKTALYVIKNGRKFEETLLTKSEERFTFLLTDNEYYPYYLYKITGDPNAISKEQKARKAAAVAAALLSKKGITVEKNSSPVSFSIKPKDDTSGNNLQQPVLPQDHSDEDEGNSNNKRSTNVGGTHQYQSVPEQVQKAIEFVESQLMARNAQLAAFSAALIGTPEELKQSQQLQRQPIQEQLEKQKQLNAVAEPKSSAFSNSLSRTTISSNASQSTVITVQRNDKIHVPLAKLEAERNALYEQQQQNKNKQLKKAEEKIKDKLAQRARDKLGGLISREKQLQFERKRKAMVFLNQIKGICRNDDEISIQFNKNNDNIEHEDGEASDDSASVHSIPITSYGPPGDNSDDEQQKKLNIGKSPPISTTGPRLPNKDSHDSHFNTLSHHHDIIACNDEGKLLKKCTTTITVSDDEDVELISETKQRRHGSKLRDLKFLKNERYSLTKKHVKHSHQRRRKSRSPSHTGSLSSNESPKQHHSKSHSSHKAKKSKTKKSKSKKKSKKCSRSRSRSHTPPNHYSEYDRNCDHRHYAEVRRCSSKQRKYSPDNSSSISPNSESHQLYEHEYQQNEYRHSSKRSSSSYCSTHISKECKRHRYD